jgi:hypothetical protein
VDARRLSGGIGTLIATNEEPKRWRDHAAALMGGDVAEFIDLQRGIYRAAAFRDGRSMRAVPRSGGRRAAMGRHRTLYGAEALADIERRMLLSGRTADGSGRNRAR